MKMLIKREGGREGTERKMNKQRQERGREKKLRWGRNSIRLWRRR